jgi:hypothetical protein
MLPVCMSPVPAVLYVRDIADEPVAAFKWKLRRAERPIADTRRGPFCPLEHRLNRDRKGVEALCQ